MGIRYDGKAAPAGAGARSAIVTNAPARPRAGAPHGTPFASATHGCAHATLPPRTGAFDARRALQA